MKTKIKAIVLIMIVLALIPFASAVVQIIKPPAINMFAINEDEPFNYTIVATGDSLPIKFNDTASQAGFNCFHRVSINQTASLMNFTATNDCVGNWTFALNAWDDWTIAAILLHFNVTNTNDRPYRSNTAPENVTSTQENGNKTLSIIIADDDIRWGDSLTVQWYLDGNISTVTDGKLNVTKINESYYNATYYPTINDSDSGLHNISVFFQDKNMSLFSDWVNYTWTVDVQNVNRPPIFNKTILNYTWDEDTSLTNISLMDHFYDPDNHYDANKSCYWDPGASDCLHFSYNGISGNISKLGITIDGAGHVNITPSLDWFGTVVLQFSVFDGYVSNYSNNVTLNITNVEDAPRIVPISDKETWAYVRNFWQINASDPDNDSITYFVDINPYLSNCSINSSGIVNLYTNQSQLGTYNISVIAGDGTLNSTPANFSVTVYNNSQPVLIPFENNYTSVEQDFGGMFTLKGFDKDNETLYIWINHTINSTSNLTANSTIFNSSFLHIDTNNATMNLTKNYTMYNFTVMKVNQSLVGLHTIRAFVNDSHNAYTTYEFTLEINDTPHPPMIYPVAVPNNQIKVNTQFNITAYALDVDGNIDAFGDNSSLFDINTTDKGSYFENATGKIEFTPVSLGYHRINITVNDTDGNQNSTTSILNVTNNRPPYFLENDTIYCFEYTRCTHQMQASDPDWQDVPNLQFSLEVINESNTSANIAMGSSGLIDFTPTVMEKYYINVTVTDGEVNVSQIFPINVSEIDNPPFFIPADLTNMSIWNNSIVENSMADFFINAFDWENETPYLQIQFLSFTDLNDTKYNELSQIPIASKFIPVSNTTTEGLVSDGTSNGTRNITHWRFRFTPTWNEVGSYLINISATDNLTYNSQIVNLSILNLNDPPTVNWSLNYPYGGVSVSQSNQLNYTLNCTENQTIYFTTDAVDHDFDDITYRWYSDNFDGSTTEVSTNATLDYQIPFNAHPHQNLTLEVKDEHGATTTIKWFLNAENVNRKITFGTREYEWNVSSDFRDNVTINNDMLMVKRKTPDQYYQQSKYTSQTMDFKEFSQDIPRIEYTRLKYTNHDNHTGNYSINISTATSRTRGALLSLWNPVPDNGSIDSNDYQFLSFKFQFNLTDLNKSPAINDIKILYKIADLNVPAQSAYQAWIDLDHFFIDPDTDDIINYSYTILEGAGLINVSLEAGHIVTLNFNQKGTAKLMFTAIDPYNSLAESNEITITITANDESQSPSPSTSGGGGGGGGGVRVRKEYIYRNKDVPLAFDIIYPDKVTIYSNETIEIPLKLVNNEKFDLSGLDIAATSDRPGVNLTLDKGHLDNLNAGESEDLMLTMTPGEIYDSYDIYVDVNVSDPAYNDSAKIMITSLKRLGTSNESEQMKLAFVRDLLQKNKECSELSEYIDRAREYIQDGEYNLADQILEQFIHDCKLLIQEKPKEIEQPTGFSSYIDSIMGNKENLIIAITIAAVILIVIIFAIAMAYQKI